MLNRNKNRNETPFRQERVNMANIFYLYYQYLEVILQHLPNILSVGEVKGRVDLIKDVQGGGLEEEKGEDQRQGDKGALAPREFTQ